MAVSDRLVQAWRALVGRAPGRGRSLFAPSTWYGDGGRAAPFVGPEFLDFITKIPTAYAAIDRVSSDAGSVPLNVYRRRGNDLVLQDPDSDEAASLFYYANAQQGRSAFWKKFWQSMMGMGEAFILLDPQGFDEPQEIFVLRADLMDLVPGPAGRVEKYVYMSGRGEVTFSPEMIYHAKFPNPLDEWRGLPPLKAAQLPAAILLEASQSSWRFLKNGMRPSMVLWTEQELDKEQVLEYQSLLETKFTEAQNHGRPFLSHSGFRPESFNTSAKDSELIELMKMQREEILSVYGVPPALVGIFEYANYANSESQVAMYWQNTIMPLLRMLEQDLTEIVLPRLEKGLVAKFDTSKVPAVVDIEIRRANELAKLVLSGIVTPNSARRQLGEPMLVGGDVGYIPLNMVPIGAEIRDQQPTIALVRSVSEKAYRGFIDTPERNQKRQTAERILDRYEIASRRELADFFEKQGQRVISRLRESDKGYGSKAARLEDLMPDDEAVRLRAVLTRILARVALAAGAEAISQIVGDSTLFLSNERIVRWLEERALQSSVLINEATRQQLARVLAAGVESSLRIGEIEDLIRATFDVGATRAAAIARTETTSAFNAGSVEGWRQSEVVEKKEWLSAGDAQVRDGHAIDGEQVALGERFSNGLEYPGDPSGDAENLVNCRCTLIPVTEGSKRVLVRRGSLDGWFATKGQSLTGGESVRTEGA